MTNIDRDQLSSVTGGVGAAKAMLETLEKRFGSQGAVSYIGHPKVTAAGASRDRVAGKFDTNALWGGDVKRTFKGLVNLASGIVSGLHTHIYSSE